jgi:hypothetical protein
LRLQRFAESGADSLITGKVTANFFDFRVVPIGFRAHANSTTVG